MENEVVKEIADKYKKTPAQILLRHLLQRNLIVIPKSTNPNRLRQNIDVFDFEFDDDEMAALDQQDQFIRICDFSFFKGYEKTLFSYKTLTVTLLEFI